jgi:RNA polymerase sigma factor (sigma-70 family)
MREQERSRLFIDYLNLVGSYASRYRGRGLDYDELVNAGAIGLGESIDLYDSGGFSNGLAAFARLRIEGAIKRALTQFYYVVGGDERTEGGPGILAGTVEYFGNVARGDGTFRADVSLNNPLANDGEHGDDEEGGGSHLDNVTDRSREHVTGDRASRLMSRVSDHELQILLAKLWGQTNKQIGGMIGTSAEGARYTVEVIASSLRRQLKADLRRVAWLDHEARVFRGDLETYRRDGIGIFYLDQRQPVMSRSLIPHNRLYREPSWTRHPKPLGLYKRDENHAAKLETFERTATGWSPVKEGPTLVAVALGYRSGVENEDKGLQAWAGRRSPQPEWKVKARKKGFTNSSARYSDGGARWLAPKSPLPTQEPPQAPKPYSRTLYLKHERTKLWQAPTVSMFASLCCSTSASLTQSETPQRTSLRSLALTSAKQ